MTMDYGYRRHSVPKPAPAALRLLFALCHGLYHATLAAGLFLIAAASELVPRGAAVTTEMINPAVWPASLAVVAFSLAGASWVAVVRRLGQSPGHGTTSDGVSGTAELRRGS